MYTYEIHSPYSMCEKYVSAYIDVQQNKQNKKCLKEFIQAKNNSFHCGEAVKTAGTNKSGAKEKDGDRLEAELLAAEKAHWLAQVCSCYSPTHQKYVREISDYPFSTPYVLHLGVYFMHEFIEAFTPPPPPPHPSVFSF
jgi:hypothetical protein